MAHIPVESRFWRTDDQQGRKIYALMSNDPTRPHELDPYIGSMETANSAQDVVDTHNGVLTRFGRRYPETLFESLSRTAPADDIYIKATPQEKRDFLFILAWLVEGPMETYPIVQKMYTLLGGENSA